MKLSKQKIIQLVIDLLAIIILFIIDQWTKHIVLTQLKGKDAIPLIKDVLEFEYLENRGAAFGMLQNKKILFIIMATIMFIIIFYILIKLPHDKKYIWWQVFLCLICAGGIGNMYDRLVLNYVVDFIYFKLINFPIFNFADICVSIGTVLLFIIVLFKTKEADLEFLKLKK